MQLAPSASQGALGRRDHQGRLERRALRARKAHKAQLAEMGSRVLWGFLVQLAPWAPLVKTEIRERSGSLDRKEARATKASRVPLGPRVPKGPLDSQAPLVQMGSQAPVDSRAYLGRKEMKVREASLGRQGPWGSRACRDLQVKRARRETWARWARPVPLAHEDHQELQVLMGLKVLQVESGIPVLWVRRGSLAKLASLAFREKGALWDPKEKEERRESPAPREPLDPLGPKALPETTAPRAALGQWVFLEILGPLESLALRVKTVPLVTKEMMVNLDRRDPRAPLASLVHPDPRESGVPQAPLAPKADKERREPREKPAWKALLGRRAPSARRGLQGSPGPTACAGSLALWESRVSPDPRAQMDHLAPWVLQDCLGSKEIQDPKVKRVTLA